LRSGLLRARLLRAGLLRSRGRQFRGRRDRLLRAGLLRTWVLRARLLRGLRRGGSAVGASGSSERVRTGGLLRRRVPARLLRPRKGVSSRYATAAFRMRPNQASDALDTRPSTDRAADLRVDGPAVPAFASSLRAYVSTRVPAQEVDDVVQDVLLRWVMRAGSIAPEELEPWLITTARNRAVDVLRARGAAPLDSEVDPGRAVDESVTKGALADLVCCLASMLEALTPEERELLRRVDADGGSQAQLAAELGLSPSGLRARVQRARARLRVEFDACCVFERDALGAVVDWRARRRDAAPPFPSCGPTNGPCADSCSEPGACC
jgi:RNA polymerase sigma-70 factor (ECF subfamily)